jgi:hypothetical protein
VVLKVPSQRTKFNVAHGKNAYIGTRTVVGSGAMGTAVVTTMMVGTMMVRTVTRPAVAAAPPRDGGRNVVVCTARHPRHAVRWGESVVSGVRGGLIRVPWLCEGVCPAACGRGGWDVVCRHLERGEVERWVPRMELMSGSQEECATFL